MAKVSGPPTPTVPTLPKTERPAPARQRTPAAQPRPSPFNNGQPDDFNLADQELDRLLKELQSDAATLGTVNPAVSRLATVFGTARSKPVPGENGYGDYVWVEALGEALRKASYSV